MDKMMKPDRFNFPGTICKPIFKACESCYFSTNTGLLKEEKASIRSLMCSQKFVISKKIIVKSNNEKKVFFQQIR